MTKEDNDVEVLARSTSVKDSLDELRQGTALWKIRPKTSGFSKGQKFYKRTFRLDLADLQINYSPNKVEGQAKSCIAKGGSVDIHLDDICEVRCGHGTDNFNSLVQDKSRDVLQKHQVDSRQTLDVNTDNCFSIIFKDGRPPLDLVAEDFAIRNHWVNALNHLVVTIKSLGEQKEHELYLRKQFQKADKNSNGVLSLPECHQLIEQLNVKLSKEDLSKMFAQANKKRAASGGEEEALDETEFLTFYYGLLKRPELDKIFHQYITNNSHKMSPKDLATFLTKEQGIDVPVEECEKFIAAYEPTTDRSCLSAEGFTQFMMFSEWQNIVDVANSRQVWQDMTRPLSHYWIASSHNTYLLGDQLTGQSSVDAYINALKEGCRCVELDCWDGDDGEPIIYHGWTLTSKILFKEVIQDAIARYAFHASDYPVILSIENHCSVEQQKVMAHHLTSILGSMLFADPVKESLGELPSPDSLKRRVLIKAKKLPPGTQGDEEIDDDEDPDDERDEKKKAVSKKIAKELSDLVNYIEAVHFHGFDHEGKFYQMSSFGEAKAFGFAEDPDKSVQFLKYNTHQISRIYPGAKRQDSSNFNPLQVWNTGCQVVALNYQTEDKPNFLNRAMFSNNGGCGYVLKPDFMNRPESSKYSPVSTSMMDKSLRVLRVTVISGVHIPRPDGSTDGDVIDPYVKVRIRGHVDDKGNKFKTQPVRDNGFNPVWNEQFTFHIHLAALAFLEFRVKDHSKSGTDKDIGAFCCPLNLVQQGYRRVNLKSYSGRDLAPASLLVHIRWGGTSDDFNTPAGELASNGM